MDFEITPEPDEETRRAILAALAEDEFEHPAASAWAEQILPRREDEQPSPSTG